MAAELSEKRLAKKLLTMEDMEKSVVFSKSLARCASRGALLKNKNGFLHVLHG